MSNPVTRRFRVHARHDTSHHARIVTEPSFEAAAIAYVEAVGPEPGDDQAVRIIVRDLDTGHEHCFRLDLGSGDVAPCG
jgi:hypothetical protein